MESKKKSTTDSSEGSNSSSNIYKSIIDNSSSAIFLSKPTGEIIEVNDAAEKMFGYSKTEFVKIGRQGILDHTDFKIPILLEQRRETGSTKGELIGIKKNNERFPVEFTSSIFTDDSGEEWTCTIMQDITNRKYVEQQMLLMLNNTEESFILLDNELLILKFNKQFKDLYKRYFQLSVENGLSILNFVKPERLEEVKKIYKNVLKGEIIFNVLATKDEDGDDHYFKIKYAPSKNEANEIIGIFITIREVTEETKSNIEIKKRQEKLEQAEVNYRELFEKAIDGIFIHELQTGKILDANQKACEIFGLNRQEILDANLSRFANGSATYSIKVLEDKLTAAGDDKPQFFEWITRHSNGTLNWVELSLQKATIAGTERILAYFRLINDRKNAEHQSELQRKDKEALINSTDDLIWSVSNDLKLLAANSAYKGMMKIVTDKNLQEGDDILIIEFGEALNTKWEDYYKRALRGEKYNVKEQIYNPSTNTIIHSLISFNPIYTNKNEIEGVACYSKNITELTEKQMAIEATKAELDNVMASSLDMICTVAKDNSIVRVSAASEIILGYKPQELIGKFIFDFVYDEDREETKNHAQEVMAGKGKPNYYNRYVRKDGSLVYLEWTAQWDEHSNNRYGVARDVTAKVEAENKLKHSEKRFRSLVQDGSDMITILDAEGKYKYASPTTLSVMGYTNENFTENSVFDLIHLDDVKQVHYYFNLLKTNKKVVVPPFRFKHHDGGWRWIETSLTNLIDEEAVNGIVANSRDITERKNIEEALIVTKENYKNLFENSPAPMYIFDFNTLQIIDCNEEALLKYGYTKDEFLQLTIKDIRLPEDVAKVEEAVSSEENYGAIHKKIWRHKKKNGEIMYMDITGHIIDYDGRRASFVMLLDITENLKIEEQKDFEKRDKEALINNTDDLIWSVSKDFKLIAANNSYIKSIESLTGVRVKTGNDVMLEEFFPKPFLDFWKGCYLRALDGEIFKEELFAEALRDRPERWLEVNFNPIYNGHEITGVACNARNITDSKKAAEELKQSEEKYRLLFYKSLIPKMIYDIDTLTIVEVNEKAIQHYGYTKEEFLKLNIKYLRPAEDFEKVNND